MDFKSMEEPPDMSNFLSIYICEEENSIPKNQKVEKDEGVSVQDFLNGLTETTITPILNSSNEESTNGNNSKFPQIFKCIEPCDEIFCGICQKYISRQKFSSHMNNHKGKRPFTCELCGKSFPMSIGLRAHLQIHNKPDQSCHCFCGRKFTNLLYLEFHLERHKFLSKDFKESILKFAKIQMTKKKERSKCLLQCPWCSLSFPGQYKLLRHIRTHTGDKPFECPCGVKFTRNEHLKKHRLCKSCPFNAAGEISESGMKTDEVKAEIKTETPNSEEDVKEENGIDEKTNQLIEGSGAAENKVLPAESVQTIDVEKNGEVILNETWKNFAKNIKVHACEYCQKVFSKNHKLNIHRRIHTGERPYTCITCGKGFSRRDHLMKHQNVHLKYRRATNLILNQSNDNSTVFQNINVKEEKMELPGISAPEMTPKEEDTVTHNIAFDTPMEEKMHYCPICSHGFKKLCNFQSHLEIHGERETFKCPVCNREFKVKKNFEAHLLNHETLLEETSSGDTSFTNSYIELAKSKRVQCPTCMKWLVSQSSLIMHMRSHTGEKPHKCDSCDRYFVRKADMMRHRRRHTGENLFPCTLCNVTYTRRDKLFAHVRRNHGDLNDIE